MLFLKFAALVLVSANLTLINGDPEDVENVYWPDLSCHPGYDRDTFFVNVASGNSWCRRTTPAPNFPDMDSEESMKACSKYCALDSMSLLNQMAEGVELKESGFLEEMFGEELGLKLSQNVITQCSEIFRQVLFEEFHECDSEKANEVYDCVENALKC